MALLFEISFQERSGHKYGGVVVDARVVLSTIFPSRLHEPSIEIKRAIEQGRFGRLTVGDAFVKWYRSQANYDSGAWRGTWELDGGGALTN